MKVIKSQKGMTIMEVVVALAILGLVSIGFVGFFTDSFKFQARNEQLATIQKIADETMEKLKDNKGVNVTIGQDILDISNMEEGDALTASDELYDYNFTVNSIKSVIKGAKFCDVTINVISKDNASITSTVNSTVRVENSMANEDNTNETIYIRYYSDSGLRELLKEEELYSGVYTVTSYEPLKQGYSFEYWIGEDNCIYNAEDEISFNEETIADKIFNLYAEWAQDERSEQTECSRHDYDNGRVIKEPTCTEKGLIRYTCNRCGDDYTEEVGPLDHDYNDGEVIKKSTCTEKGLIKYTCNRCPECYTEDILPSHSYVGVKTEAKCTEKGNVTYTCSECEASYSVEIAALGHDWNSATGYCRRCPAECAHSNGFEFGENCRYCGLKGLDEVNTEEENGL